MIAFVRFLRHQIYCRMCWGTNRLSLFFMGFLVPILFAWPANDGSLPQTYRKWQYHPVLWFHSAQEEALPLDVLSRSVKKRLFSSVTLGEAHSFLPSVGMATGWHAASRH